MSEFKKVELARPYFDNDEVDQVSQVLESGWVTQGPKTSEFEKMFAMRHESKFALATTSCTAALHLSLLALGITNEDEVIVPAFTWVTSAHAIEYVGAKPVFVDIALEDFNIDCDLIESAINRKTKAILVVHLFGKAANMLRIIDIARKNNLYVIEDAACAVGTTFNSVPVGTFGDLGCFSFHPRKVISTGEGGMVLTNSLELFERISYLRNHGATQPPMDNFQRRNYQMNTFDHLGYNLRLSDIQSAVGVAQMKKLDMLLVDRRKTAELYLKLLKNNENFTLPTIDLGHTFQSFVVLLKREDHSLRNFIMDWLQNLQIDTRPGTHCVPSLGYYRNKYGVSENFPSAIFAESMSITLPIVPFMSEEMVRFVVTSIEQAVSEYSSQGI